jgi:PAS domain S-box-containing protein
VQSRYLIVNKSLAKAYGKSPAEMTSRTDADFLPPEMAARCRASEKRVLAGDTAFSWEDTTRFPDGQTRTMITTMVPFRDARGKVCGLAGIGRDITDRKEIETALRDNEARLRYAMEVSQIGEWELNPDNNTATRSLRHDLIFGYDRLLLEWTYEKFLGHVVPADRKSVDQKFRHALKTGEDWDFECRIIRRDQSVRWIWASGRFYPGEQAKARRIVGIIRDVTERKRAEQLLQRVNRTLRAIRDCHEAMLRAGTEHELLDQICHIIVKTAGERMAWVGFAEHDANKTVRPVAVAGSLKDYLARARVTWADTPRGRGPVGTAIRTGQVSICHNTQTDPAFALWRKDARRLGYGSVMALPLTVDDKCLGALCLYSPEPDTFDQSEQILLTDLANDLAFGISMLRLRAERDRLEDEILKSIEREQERIGRDLHDGLCQLLVGAKFRSVYMKQIAQDRLPAVAQEAVALERTLNEAIEQARDLARGLNPVKCTPEGLSAALQKLAEDVNRARGPHCFCQFPEPVRISDHHILNHLFRIAQEAVQNALKHSRAKNISITLTRQDGLISLIVKDDGRGLPRASKSGGMGLKNMQTRARLIGGRLEIRRRKHGGTAVTCSFSPAKKSKP